MKQRTILIAILAVLLCMASSAQAAVIGLHITASAPQIGLREIATYTITAQRTDPNAESVIVRIAVDPGLTIIGASTSPGNCDWRASDNVVACLSVASASAPMVVDLSVRGNCADAGRSFISTAHAALAATWPDGEAADASITTLGEACVWLPITTSTQSAYPPPAP